MAERLDRDTGTAQRREFTHRQLPSTRHARHAQLPRSKQRPTRILDASLRRQVQLDIGHPLAQAQAQPRIRDDEGIGPCRTRLNSKRHYIVQLIIVQADVERHVNPNTVRVGERTPAP